MKHQTRLRQYYIIYLEARGLCDRDLESSIGNSEQVTAILNRQQPLTLHVIRRLNKDLGLPAEILIQPYSLINLATMSNNNYINYN